MATAQVITNPTSADTAAFGSTVTFRRADGRVQKYRIAARGRSGLKAGSFLRIARGKVSDRQSYLGFSRQIQSSV